MCDSPFVLIPQAVWIACNGCFSISEGEMIMVSIPQAVWIACNDYKIRWMNPDESVSIPQAVWIACNAFAMLLALAVIMFQYRKRYGLHAIGGKVNFSRGKVVVSIPQAVWIACNTQRWSQSRRVSVRFNTASGMDCMQYRPSQPLGQLNPEAGFLNGSLFWTDRRNLAGFFCRQNRLKTSANPVISRKLLSTGKI